MWTVHTGQAGSFLFGQVGRLERELCLPIGAMVGVVALGIWAIIKVKRWRDEAGPTGVVPPAEQLDHYQQMVAEGLLEPQELARIQAQLEAKSNPHPPTPAVDVPPQDQPPDHSIQEK